MRRYKIIALLWLTSLFACSAFMLEVDLLAARVDVLLTSFLSIIAFLFVINDNMPRTPFLHKLDFLVAISLGFLFTACVISWLAYGGRNHFGEENGDVCNTVCAIVLIVGWLLLQIKTFGIPYYRYTMKDLAERPSYIDDLSEWTPLKDMVVLNLWKR